VALLDAFPQQWDIQDSRFYLSGRAPEPLQIEPRRAGTGLPRDRRKVIFPWGVPTNLSPDPQAEVGDDFGHP
jgi:hypothetical protein